MSSPDIKRRGKASSAELNVPFGSVKEATSIPLLPSLSLSSTVGSVMTVYHGEESDLRDETHHVDVNMDSMREGADDMSELQRCESSMSVLTCYSSAEVEVYVQPPGSCNNLRSQASGVRVIEEIPNAVVDSLLKSMSLHSNKTSSVMDTAASEEVEVSFSRSCSTQNSGVIPLSVSHSRSTLSSKLSKRIKTNAGVDQIALDLSNSMSMTSSQKSSNKEDMKALTLSRSRSNQSSKSTSKQTNAASVENILLPISRSTSTNSEISSNSAVSFSVIPLSVSHSHSTLSSKLSKRIKSNAGVDQIALDLSNSMSMTSSQKSSNKEDMKALDLSRSRSNQSSKSTSKQTNPASVENILLPISRSTSSNSEISSNSAISFSASTTTTSSGVYTTLEDVAGLHDESLVPPSVSRSVSTSSSTFEESVEERTAEGLPVSVPRAPSIFSSAYTPRAGFVVAEAEADYNTIHEEQVDMKLSRDDSKDASLEAFSSATGLACDAQLHVEEEAIWDNPIEVSYSEMGIDDMESVSSEEALTSVDVDEGKELLVKKEVVGELAVDDAASTPARKKVKWSSKLNQIRVFSNTKSPYVEEKKLKSTSLLNRFKKKNRKEERDQDETVHLLGQTGILEWEDMKQAGLSVTMDNHVLCASPAWNNNMCNFQEEVKSTMSALTEEWSKRELDKNKSDILWDDYENETIYLLG